jgi:hypothetical protein
MITLYYCDGEGKSSMMLDVLAKAQSDVDILIYPESGLHPKDHADIFDKAFKANLSLCSHSELIMLRLLTRMTEGTITADDVVVKQLTPDLEWVTIEFKDNFPINWVGSFFENAFDERF